MGKKIGEGKEKKNQKNYFIKANSKKNSKNPRKIPKNSQKFSNNSI